MNGNIFNPDMLILARESRGLTQAGLSRESGVVQSAISKYENNMLTISEENLDDIAKALKYPKTLFTRSDVNLDFGSTCLYHRKRQSIPVLKLRQIQARVYLMRMHVQRLLLSATIETNYEFPRFDISEYDDDPELIASIVRVTWRLPIGPIRNLVAVIERAGAIVVPLSFGTQKLDAISQWPPNMPPLLFINIEMPWERIRFSLAHEIGHLVMHQHPTLEQEAEADAFASALLMPARDIMSDLKGITIPRAAQLKPYWRVSMQALIRRAYNLKRLTQSQYRRLFTLISKFGYRRMEPNALSQEMPTTLNSIIDIHLQDHQYSVSELCELLDLYRSEFETDYRPRTVGPITILK